MDVRHVLAAALRVGALLDLDPEPARRHLGLMGRHVLDLGQIDIEERRTPILAQLERHARLARPLDGSEALLEELRHCVGLASPGAVEQLATRILPACVLGSSRPPLLDGLSVARLGRGVLLLDRAPTPGEQPCEQPDAPALRLCWLGDGERLRREVEWSGRRAAGYAEQFIHALIPVVALLGDPVPDPGAVLLTDPADQAGRQRRTIGREDADRSVLPQTNADVQWRRRGGREGS